MDPKEFGSEIATLRKERGFTQRQLAERLGVTDKAVSRWERGVGYPDITLLVPLAEALEVDISQLLGIQAAPSPAPQGKEYPMTPQEEPRASAVAAAGEAQVVQPSKTANTTLITLRSHRKKLLAVAACVAALIAVAVLGVTGAFLPQIEVPQLVGSDAGEAYARLQAAGFTHIEGYQREVGGDGSESPYGLSSSTKDKTVIVERPGQGSLRADAPITLVVESTSEREELEKGQAELAAWNDRVATLARQLAEWQTAQRLSSTETLQLDPATSSGQSLASSLVALSDAAASYEAEGVNNVELALPDGLRQSYVTDGHDALYLEVACTYQDATGASHTGLCSAKVVGEAIASDHAAPQYAVVDLQVRSA